jgi:3,4-dihydroxy 2-butanone 4-phosphate synthase/GTP cyclohydrolase II
MRRKAGGDVAADHSAVGVPVGPAVVAGAPDPSVAVAAAHAALRRSTPVVIVSTRPGAGRRAIMVLAAEAASPEGVALVVRYTSGYVCVALGPEDAIRLGLPRLGGWSAEAPRIDATVTVDAAEDVSTGISARDRARTIRLLGGVDTEQAELSRPGHVVPVVAGLEPRVGREDVDELPAAARRLVAAATGRSIAAFSVLVSEWDPAGLPTPGEISSFCADHGIPLLDSNLQPVRTGDLDSERRGRGGAAGEDRYRSERRQRRAG